MPYAKGRTYEDYVGVRGLERLGTKKWRRHVQDVVERLAMALEADDVVIGGGNAKRLKRLPDGARLQQPKCLHRRLPTLGRALGSARRGWTARPGEEVIRTSDDPGLEAVAARGPDLIEDGATVGLGSGALYGRSTPSISGASSSGRCSRSGSPPSWRAWRSRRSSTTARPTLSSDATGSSGGATQGHNHIAEPLWHDHLIGRCPIPLLLPWRSHNRGIGVSHMVSYSGCPSSQVEVRGPGMGGSSPRPPTAQRACSARARRSSRCSHRSSHPESVTQALTPRHWSRSRTQPLTQGREAHSRSGSPRYPPSLAPALADGVACLARTRAPNDRPLIASIKLRGNPSVQRQRFARR
jgi:hypothetical protein